MEVADHRIILAIDQAVEASRNRCLAVFGTSEMTSARYRRAAERCRTAGTDLLNEFVEAVATLEGRHAPETN